MYIVLYYYYISGQTGQWFGRPLLLLYNTWHQTAAANRRTAATAAGPFKIASKFKIWIAGFASKLKKNLTIRTSNDQQQLSTLELLTPRLIV